MRIDLYTRCWNDAHMLGFMFRNFDDIVHRYVVFDDGSTDRSIEILKSHPKVELRSTPPYAHENSRVLSGLVIMEDCWKESRGRADWVIATDIDEHLYHPDLRNYLRACQSAGVTAIPALGYQMLADEFPPEGIRLSERLTFGAPFHEMSKLNIFDPDAISSINYRIGRHSAVPTGDVIVPERDELMILHYKYLGLEHTQRRHEQSLTRQRERDIAQTWGHRYSWSRDELLAEWKEFETRCVDVSSPDLRPWDTHGEPRWWADFQRSAVSLGSLA